MTKEKPKNSNIKSTVMSFIGVFCWAVFLTLLSLLLCAKSSNGSALIFSTYFYKASILILNFLPFLLIVLFFYFLTNRLWVSGLISSLITIVMLYINEIKVCFRNDVFTAVDLTLAVEAMKMAERYSLVIDKVYLACVPVIGALVFLCAKIVKKGFSKNLVRVIGALLSFLLLVASASPLYMNERIYQITENMTRTGKYMSVFSEKDQFISRGFAYSFINSFGNIFEKAPENYREEDVEKYIESFAGEPIPDDKKINVISVMLEAYNDFDRFSGVKFSKNPYTYFHSLQKKSISGRIYTNDFGGGTVNTERSFITGFTDTYEFRHPIDTYARYFKENGYTVEGSHPGHNWFYKRDTINGHMGFDNYYFFENRYETIYNEKQEIKDNVLKDQYLFEDIWSLYEENKESGKPYFSFSVSYQNHGPYNSDSLDGGVEYARKTKNMSDEAYYYLNNYLAGLESTGSELKKLIGAIDGEDEPILFVAFGDHNPWLGNDNLTYHELGINIDRSTADGIDNYYSTPYIIYANEAAKKVIGSPCVGDGGDFSAMFLMNKVFDVMGIEGDSYSKITDKLKESVDVMTKEGFYRENGVFSTAVSPETRAMLDEFEKVKYYRKHHKVK